MSDNVERAQCPACPAEIEGMWAQIDHMVEKHPELVRAQMETWCPSCGRGMVPEHAHYRCRACGYRDSCCQ